LPFKPNPAYNDQDQRFSSAFSVLTEGIAAHAFPAASVAVLSGAELVAFRGFGHYTYEPASPAVSADTIFDLASVTKVVATTTVAAILFQRRQLHLDTPIVELGPEFRTGDPRRQKVTVRSLLTHTSGLPAHRKFYQEARTRNELLQAAFTTAIEIDPGSRTEYSDIGFIILGVILERLAGEPLDVFTQREILTPLGMTETCFRPSPELAHRIVPTADDKHFRHKIIQGEVNDENAWLMGGVAGHAGLFSTAYDVALFASCWLGHAPDVLSPVTIAEFTRQQVGTSRALGWDRPTAASQSGQYLSSNAFGHLGYTGTSLWIDASRQLAIVLLTNRTWPHSDNQQIKVVRPRFHDKVMCSLDL
jgi:CubicO group peptidase (beta-lactamase class C family)